MPVRRHLWVNLDRTCHHQIAGVFLWLPKRNANGAENPFDESIRAAARSDVVFSLVDTKIATMEVAESFCWDGPKSDPPGQQAQTKR